MLLEVPTGASFPYMWDMSLTILRAAEVTALQRDLAHYRAQLILAARLQKLHESERNHAEWSLECAEGRLDFLHQQCELERERYDELEHLRHNVAREQEDLDSRFSQARTFASPPSNPSTNNVPF